MTWRLERLGGRFLIMDGSDLIAEVIQTHPNAAENARRIVAASEPVVDADGDEIISPYEWLAQEFERLAVLRKMWTAHEIAATIRRHDIERSRPPVDSDEMKALREALTAAREVLIDLLETPAPNKHPTIARIDAALSAGSQGSDGDDPR